MCNSSSSSIAVVVKNADARDLFAVAVVLVFFQISKNVTFYVFLEMTYQKVVKSL